MPSPPEACQIAGVRYASRLLTVVNNGTGVAIDRQRGILAPGERCKAHDVIVELDRVSSHEVAAEASRLDSSSTPHPFVAQTEQYLGSTVVSLRAPRG